MYFFICCLKLYHKEADKYPDCLRVLVKAAKPFSVNQINWLWRTSFILRSHCFVIAPFDIKSAVTKGKYYFSLYFVVNIQVPRASESSREKKVMYVTWQLIKS